MAGFKMHALGVLLIVIGVAGVIWSASVWTTWRTRGGSERVREFASANSASAESLLA
jgi:hypothetical protein